MTTLTERLRTYQFLASAKPGAVLELAQELHALLVECGEGMKEAVDAITAITEGDPYEGQLSHAYKKVRKLLTKLEQAGIV